MITVNKVIFNVLMQDILVGVRKYKRIKYRSRTDVMAAILEATTSGKATRSSIYNKSFLNYERFRAIMSFLIEKEFIEMSGNEDSSRLYRATEKGLHFLRIYNNMRELINLM
ncbi:MAG TPA: winged helix-turn-helix domain-containing protein [Nitrososphaeraceae archaeon]|nr:winged helix-turn-helix domain-containing protein [Nitrososphaeraceae archaeon]